MHSSTPRVAQKGQTTKEPTFWVPYYYITIHISIVSIMSITIIIRMFVPLLDRWLLWSGHTPHCDLWAVHVWGILYLLRALPSGKYR